MPYDETLDITLHSVVVPGDVDCNNKDIEFKVASYDGGVPKLQLTRVCEKGYHSKLGRLTRAEIERVRDKMTELLEMQLDIEEPEENDDDDARSDQQG